MLRTTADPPARHTKTLTIPLSPLVVVVCRYDEHHQCTDYSSTEPGLVNGGTIVNGVYQTNRIVTAYVQNVGHSGAFGTETGPHSASPNDTHNASKMCEDEDSVRVYHSREEMGGHHCKILDTSDTDTCTCKCNSLFRGAYNPKNQTLFDHTIAPPADAPTPGPTSWPTKAPTPACVPGRYTVGGAAGVCEHCPHGQISFQYNQADCLACGNGQFAVAPATFCTNCAPGQYHQTSAQACKTCDKGQFAAAHAQVECLHCPAGQYQDEDVYDKCEDCPLCDSTGTSQCVDTAGSADYTCECNPGFDGDACANNIDECRGGYIGAILALFNNPCHNGGTCTDAVNGFSCSCSGGHTGSECEIDCSGAAHGGATLDCTGTCNGDATADCEGTCNGGAAVDCAGVCSGSAFDEGCGCAVACCTQPIDCLGVCGGSASPDCHGACNGAGVSDACGVCDGDSSSCCALGCDGVYCSGAVYDACSVCDGDGSSCAPDCAGTPGGSATMLACGCNDATSCDYGCGPNNGINDGCGCGVTDRYAECQCTDCSNGGSTGGR
jgi:hypothetical protein